MLVFNYRFFLLNVLIWSIFMLGIKIRMVLKSELDGLHENVQHFDPRYIGSREMHKTKKATTLQDTLYNMASQRQLPSALLRCPGLKFNSCL